MKKLLFLSMLALIFCACSNECSLLVSSQGEISRDKNGMTVPKCLDSKARIVNINLTPQY